MSTIGSVLRLAAAAMLSALAVLAAGCGGGNSDDDQATAWVNGVCTSFTTWADNVNKSLDSVKSGNLSESSINAAVDDVKSATSGLKSDLQKQGAPDTDAGKEAEDKITTFTDDVTAAQDQVASALEGANGLTEMLSAAAAASSTLTSLAAEAKQTFDDLQSLTSAGSDQLKDAFNGSDSCKPVREQLDKLGGQPTAAYVFPWPPRVPGRSWCRSVWLVGNGPSAASF